MRRIFSSTRKSTAGPMPASQTMNCASRKFSGLPAIADDRQHQHRGEGREADERLAVEDGEVVVARVARRAAAEVLPAVEPRVGEVREVVVGRVRRQPVAGHQREDDQARDVDREREEEPPRPTLGLEPRARGGRVLGPGPLGRRRLAHRAAPYHDPARRPSRGRARVTARGCVTSLRATGGAGEQLRSRPHGLRRPDLP